MRTVYKYRLHQGYTEIPETAILLKFAMQDDKLCVWALVHIEDIETKKILVTGTGQRLPDTDDLEYFDTIFDGPYVWHVFEVL